MKVELIDYTRDAVEKLISTKMTRLEQSDETYQKVVNMSKEEKEHELKYMAKTIPSSWEFVNYTFRITGVTRAFTHQFVRTRQGSYAQQTMRMLEMEAFDFVKPKTVEESDEANHRWDEIMADIQHGYNELLAAGIPPEDARGILPTNICTNIIAQFNLRTLSEMAKSRTGGRTQSEYRDVFNAMCEAMLEVHPWAEWFLFPDKWKRLNDLESYIQRGRKVDAQKIVDQLKKETQG